MAALAGAHGDRTVSPSAQWVAPEAKRPNLIFGPCRSASTPTARQWRRRLPDPLIGDLVIVVVAVAEVHSGDVHSGLDQRSDQVVPLGGRPESADDFPASRHDDSA